MKIDYKSPLSRLSLLEYLSYPLSSDFLKDYYLIGCQHLLPSTHLMLRSCFDMGLKPERTALIGKCYSTSSTTQALMREEGVYICPSSAQFDSHQPYDDQFQKNIAVFSSYIVDKLKIPSHAKLIILDDGGELISLVNNVSSKFERIIGIEQTSSGYHKLSSINLKFPVINVARCSTKLMIESPMIIEAQVRAIEVSINKYGLKLKRMLIAGNGALGKHFIQAFRPRYDVVCYDKIPQLSEIHKKNLDISKFDFIIGTTGNSFLAPKHISNLRDGVVLASASSSDREFTASYFRRKIEKLDNCHTDLFVDGKHLLNCGFPVNFQGKDADTLPLEEIQLTVGLLFAAIYQGVSSQDSKKGFNDLTHNIQKSVLNKYSRFKRNAPLLRKHEEVNLKHVG